MDVEFWLIQALFAIAMTMAGAYLRILKSRIDTNTRHIEKMQDDFHEVSLQLARLSGQLESMNGHIERLIDNIELLNRSYRNGSR